MPFWLILVLARSGRLLSRWYLVPMFVLLVFSISWPLMWWFEPVMAHPRDYYYWFITTISSTGYGDITPKTTGGRVIAVSLMTVGFVALGMVLGQVTALLISLAQRRLKGVSKVTHLNNHVVIIGWDHEHGPELIAQLNANDPHDIAVLVAPDQLAERPFADDRQLHFRRGLLTDEQILSEVCARAKTVIVDVDGDDAVIVLTARVRRVCPDVRLVPALRNPRHAVELSHLADVTCVQQDQIHQIAGEALCRGMSRVLSILSSNLEGVDIFPLTVPDACNGLTYGQLRAFLEDEDTGPGALVIALMHGQADPAIKPRRNTPLQSGDTVFYIADAALPDTILAQLPQPAVVS